MTPNPYNIPLVSCLCVSNNRAHHLKRSILCFQSQTYPNKELVIVHPFNDEETIKLIQLSNDKRIKSIAVRLPNKISLGDLRNISIESANGEYACTWDDDDWYHQDRIKQQMHALFYNHKEACILSKIIFYDRKEQCSYMSRSRLWENTLLYNIKEIRKHKIKYPPLNRDEDYVFANEIIKAGIAYPLHAPLLYIYHVSGENTCHREHFEMLMSEGHRLSAYQNNIVSKAISEELTAKQASIKMLTKAFCSTLQHITYDPDRT